MTKNRYRRRHGARRYRGYHQTSLPARESILSSVADIVFSDEPMTDDEKREKRRWTNEINDGTQGYITAWILKLGGYLD